MRQIHPALLLALIAMAWPHSGKGEIPVLELHQGTSSVALSVVNAIQSDLSGVTVAIDHTALPVWLDVQEAPKRIAVPKGSHSPGHLTLVVRVRNAPPGGEVRVPFRLEDSGGRRWYYSFRVRTSAGATEGNILLGNSPNPFNPFTVVRFTLRENCRAMLTIYNSPGQKVRTLTDGWRCAGNHAVMWDGRDDSGRMVSGGVYICRLRAGGYELSHKMALVR